MKARTIQQLEKIAKDCDQCAADNDQAANEYGEAGAKGEARAWRAVAAEIRAVIRNEI
jgi:hypothetical protein